MKDDYGNLDSCGETYIAQNFELECGQILKEAHARYNTYGELNSSKSNCIVVCHALSGNSRLDQWWGSMLGPGRVFDTEKYFIICANLLGSCYGSTGPSSINPHTQAPYGRNFPKITIRDSVRLHIKLLRDYLQIHSVYSVIGGSLGGMQALEWTLLAKDLVKSAVVIGCGAQHSAWQIGFSELQRKAIFMDQRWNDGNINFSDPPLSGLSLARQIAMMSYRTAESYATKFGRNHDNSGNWQVQNYLSYQGKKFLDRFDALTYVKITEIMDSHDVGAFNRGGIQAALSSIRCPVLVVGMNTDLIYPIKEQEELASFIPGSSLKIIDTPDGHDGFLLEQDQVAALTVEFLDSVLLGN